MGINSTLNLLFLVLNFFFSNILYYFILSLTICISQKISFLPLSLSSWIIIPLHAVILVSFNKFFSISLSPNVGTSIRTCKRLDIIALDTISEMFENKCWSCPAYPQFCKPRPCWTFHTWFMKMFPCGEIAALSHLYWRFYFGTLQRDLNESVYYSCDLVTLLVSFNEQ